MPDALKRLKVPRAVLAAIASFREKLAAKAGENLVCLAVYGGVAEGRYTIGSSDINVAVVLRKTGIKELKAIEAVLQDAARVHYVVPYILSERELSDVAAAFPLILLEIRDSGVVIAGRNCFQSLQVDRERVRLRCEQELRNRLIRLRRDLVLAGDDPLEYQSLLRRKATAVAVDLRWLLIVAGKDVSAGSDPGAILKMAIDEFAFDERLSHLALFKTNPDRAAQMAKRDLMGLARVLLRVLEKACRISHELIESETDRTDRKI